MLKTKMDIIVYKPANNKDSGTDLVYIIYVIRNPRGYLLKHPETLDVNKQNLYAFGSAIKCGINRLYFSLISEAPKFSHLRAHTVSGI